MAAVTQVVVGNSALESALRKARWRIIPLLAVCYLVAYMDRVNISFAAQSMNRDLHFTPKIYGLGAGLFFLSYALCEVPSNAALLRFGARRWLARIMLTWGLLAAAMMFVRTPMHFYGARVLLGCAEAGYFPGAAYFLSRWFPQSVRSQTMSQFYVALPISTVVMGGLAGSLLRLNGWLGLAGWQWMFVIEAAPAVVLAFVVWFALPDTPANAKWLDAEEREALERELASDPHNAKHSGGLAAVVRNRRVWLLGLLYFFQLGTSYALAFSLPLLLTQLTGWDTGRVGYLVAAAGVVGAVAMLVNAWHSDKMGERRWHIAGLFFLMVLMALTVGMHLSGWVAVVALLMTVASGYAMLGPLTGVLATIVPGEAAAIAIAVVNMCGICGGFVGPYWMGWMREATGGYAWGIGALCIPAALGGLLILHLLRPVERMPAVG